MRNVLKALAFAQLIFIASVQASQAIPVSNLQAVTAGMTQSVVLKIIGSPAACTFLGRLVRLKPQDPTSKWVIKAEQRSCLKTKGGDLTIETVQALVPLDALPIPQKSVLSLYVRDGN